MILGFLPVGIALVGYALYEFIWWTVRRDFPDLFDIRNGETR